MADRLLSVDSDTFLPPTPVVNALQAVVAASANREVVHLDDPTVARPSTTGRVSWYGSVYPNNLAVGDIWYTVTQQAVEPPIVWHTDFSASTLALADLASVGTWPDQSGNGHDLTQATSTKKPTFHVAAGAAPAYVRFDGGDVMATPAFSPLVTQPGTLILAVRMTTVTTSSGVTKRIVDGLDATNEWVIQQRGSGTAPLWQGGAATTATATATPPVAGAWTIITFIPDGATGALRVNGETKTTTNFGALSLGGLTVGAKFDQATVFADFDLGDLRLCAGVLSAGNLAATERFLADRYGVTIP